MAAARPDERTRRGSLIVSLVAALLVVAALPFGLAAYQIHLARESLVDQAQRTHLIAARASADRVAVQLGALRAAAESAAQNPLLYDDPNSDAAREVLAGLLVGQPSLRAAATFYVDGDRESLVQMARQADAGDISAERLRAQGAQVSLARIADHSLLGVAQPTPRPGLRVALLASAETLAETLEPRELGAAAQLLLLQGDQPHPLAPASAELPAPLLEAIRQPQLDALAVRVQGERGIAVAAFARIAGSNWSIASLQPAAEAESAASAMRRGALAAGLAVLALVAALSVFAWRRVVRPVRALLDWQRGVLASDGGSGGDLGNLKLAFEQIARHQRNREALSEVFLGRYRLLSTLGQGAMGSVFLAWDPRLKRHVAIKTIQLEALDAARQKALGEMLEGEAVAIAKLNHPNIVSVFDLEAAGQFAFVVMEYVEGSNLRSLVRQHGALPAAEVVYIARALLRALDAAHRGGLLHLDIKPANVLVPPEGELRLTDFGVAAWRSEIPQLVARGGPAGTPGFIAPEFVMGEAPSERSDLYSLGRLLVECATGQHQNLSVNKLAELRKLADRPLLLPDALLRAQPALCAALESLCAVDPSARPASAAAALALFEPLSDAGGADALAARASTSSGAAAAALAAA